MEKKFEIGATVKLKSGGPTMTVTKHIYPVALRGQSEFRGTVQCSWFYENKINYSDFPQDALELAN